MTSPGDLPRTENDSVETHTVLNQATPLQNYNAFESDRVLQDWLKSFKGEWIDEEARAYGEKAGGELIDAGFLANIHKPEFHSHDRFGYRIDLVEYHPAYHQLMQSAIEAGHHSLPWNKQVAGAHVARAAITYLHTQADPGSGCPLTMTFASVPAIQHQPDIAAQWIPKITANHYDPRNIPYFEKQGLTIGMAMTEKQGGSDVRANTTRAVPLVKKGPGNAYLITGHKWFCSAPMCDAFLVLAYSEGGLSCFLLPRWKPDGAKNQMWIQRLKNKLGNVSNASSEVEYRKAFAWMIGEEGRGVRTIIEMVVLTRFDCMVGSASLMRQAAAQALHHTSGRDCFGLNLHQQPLMQNVLADLALESEAALAMAMRVGHALDESQHNEQEALFLRLATAVGKYWICKKAPQHTYEAMECIGGSGYVEENILPRLYREAPVNAIWEGSGNIQCLDVLRAIQKDPRSFDAFISELETVKGSDKAVDQLIYNVKDLSTKSDSLPYAARKFVEAMALGLQSSILLKNGLPLLAEAFIASRVQKPGVQYGTLPTGIDCKAIIERALPQF